MVRVDRAFLHPDAVSGPVVSQLRRAFPAALFSTIAHEREIRCDLDTPGRHAVYIGPRSSSFVSRFQPPRGMICSSFWKFTSETFCPMACHYCYLSLTFRIMPYLRIASNVEDGLVEMERVLRSEAKAGRRVMFNVGELADGRILDPITHLSRQVLSVLEQHPNGMLHVLTKAGSDTLGNYLELSHLARGRVIHVASVNPQRVADLTEEDTAPVVDRLKGLRELQRAGYRIRLRIDPIFDLRSFGDTDSNAFGVYDDLVDEIAAWCEPEMVTLGSYRPSPQLIPHIRRRYPNSLVLQAETRKMGAKRRMLHRHVFYKRIATRLRATFPEVRVALCKETRDIWHKSGLSLGTLECSCLPLACERNLAGVV